MKRLHISIGNVRGTVAIYHECGGDLAGRARELMEDGDESAVREFIEYNFEEEGEQTEHCVIPTPDDEECAPVAAVVQDEDGETVFDGEVDGEWMYSVHGNPADWRCDESVPEGIRSMIEKYKAEYPAIVAKLVADGDLQAGETDNPDAVAEAIETCTTDGGLVIDCCPEMDGQLYAAEIHSTYGICFEGDIEVGDGEEFDPGKLTVWEWDNDWRMYDAEGIRPCVLPLVKYGDTFYQLELEEWSSHYSDYRIVEAC